MLRVEVGGKGCEAPPVVEEANRCWRSGRLFARILAEKDGNRKRSVTRLTMPLVQAGQGEPNFH